MSTPAPVSRLEHLRTLRYANLDGAFAAAFATLVSGGFLVGFVKHLNGGDIWMGLFAAIPPLLGLLQIPGALWGRRFTSFRPYVLPGGLLWRLLHIPLIFVPFLPVPTEVKLLVMLVSIGLAAASVQLVGPIYNDWLAEMIPPNSRGWFFSRRNAMMAVVGGTVALLGGFLTDFFTRRGQQDLGFSVTCALGIGFSLVSQYYFNKMTDLPRPNTLQASLKSAMTAMSAPFRDRVFRQVLVFFTFFVIAQSFAGNLFAAFAFESIQMSMALFQVAAICHAAGNLLASKMWGFLADKYGNKPVLAIVMVGISLTPLQWVFLQPGQDVMNGVLLGLGHIFTGACWSGVALTQYNLLLATASEEDRPNYIGAGLALQSVMGAVGPMLGAICMSGLRGVMSPEMAYHTVFYVTMGLRLLSLLLLARVNEFGSVSIRSTLGELARFSPAGLRALREMRFSEEATKREGAIAAAGASQLTLARAEIIKALHDPSPGVRRQAAASLAMIGGPDATEALIHQVQDHPDLVDEEIIEALGELREVASVPVLKGLLQSPRSFIRRSAAKAIAKIGGPEAVIALRWAASRAEDLDLRRAALQGLRRLQATEAEPEVSAALLDPVPSVRVAAAEAVAELMLNDSVEIVRESLGRFHDEACGEMAYALGCLGNLSDLPAIIHEASMMESMITQRRCLLGAARLVGVERGVYRLFLLESMALDAELVTLLGPTMRSDPRLRQALDSYISGDEHQALKLAAEIAPQLKPFAEVVVKDAFLVAAFAITRSNH